ncbi:glutamate-5-semialdehyde dehydrogenase [bacterium c-19]|nr:glutamate-5-semialdehyde dehydrogenase [bacterium c-19]
MNLLTQAQAIKAAAPQIAHADSEQKNQLLEAIADELIAHTDKILNANEADILAAKAAHKNENRIDRMLLDAKRIQDMIIGIRQVIALPDPIGDFIPFNTLDNGLKIAQMRVPLGVVGMIYEARPNVTIDAAVLCLKAGNAVFLRGSKDIMQTNHELIACMKRACKRCGFPCEIIQFVEDPSHKSAECFMRLHGYLDVLIPRGGAELIAQCVEKASVPLIETGTGNCHIYVDSSADFDKAAAIIINAKTQRTSVCNACESVLIHQDCVDQFAPRLIQLLKEHNVTIHGDERIAALDCDILPADENDYAKEYLDLEISIKTVTNINEAIIHINQYSTHHSDAIIAENTDAILQFLAEIDSACVYANASTRFSDGFEFGLGAEIGISTQKLHARGPMGLGALTTTKYIIQGNGQIRK